MTSSPEKTLTKVNQKVNGPLVYDGPRDYPSAVLEKLGLETGSACDFCPNAGWHRTADGSLRNYCKSMGVLIDSLIVDCELQMQTLAELSENENGTAE